MVECLLHSHSLARVEAQELTLKINLTVLIYFIKSTASLEAIEKKSLNCVFLRGGMFSSTWAARGA